MNNKNGNNAGKPARHGAARNLVATGKAVAQRGKQTLQAQRDNLIRLVGRAEALKPQRRQLRRMARDATNAYRANPQSGDTRCMESGSRGVYARAPGA
jgi:hypothetical protein